MSQTPEEKRAHDRAYRLANRERDSARRKVYRAANREKLSAKDKIHYAAHKEERAERGRAWRAANPEKAMLYNALYRKNHAVQQKAHRAANREKYSAYSKAYGAANREHLCKSMKIWREKNRTRLMEARLMREYGISIDVYNDLLERQSGACAICGCPNWRGSEPRVDHDHSTGKVRGLLCRNCNLVLGMIGDDPKTAQGIVEYLRHHAPKTEAHSVFMSGATMEMNA
jgi:hypothetical protein